MKPGMIAIIAAGLLLGVQGARADAMRCSTELKTCIANCAKNTNRAAVPVCITNCRTRNSTCVHSGCWDDGVRRYCGLQRQVDLIARLTGRFRARDQNGLGRRRAINLVG